MVFLSAYIMTKDVYWNGDEAVTYGMANSYHQGWMLSQGRVVAYIEENVIGDSLSETISGLKSFVIDIAKNKKKASYFTYPRPSETGWYSQDQVRDWFYITEGEGFNYASVYLNAMGDDANSFLYYMLVHTSGSLFPAISGTSWAGYLVNLVASVITLLLLWKIGKYLGFSYGEKIFTCSLYAISLDFFELVTLSRAYAVSTMMHMLLIMAHVLLMKSICEEDEKQEKRNLLFLVIIYVLGYVTHYAILFFSIFLGIAMTIWYIYGKHKHVNRYLITGTIAIVLGMIADPVSVVGLLMKLGNASHEGLNIIDGIMNSVLHFLFPNRYLAYVFLSGGFALAVFLVWRHCREWKNNKDSLNIECKLFIASAISAEIICVQAIIGQDYYKALYPMIILLGVDLFYHGIEEIVPHSIFDKIGKYVWVFLTACICILVYFNVTKMIQNKEAENQAICRIRTILDDNQTPNAIFLRNHASAYEFFPELQRYENTLVITDMDDVPVLDKQELLEEHKAITCISTVGEAGTEGILHEMEQMGYEGKSLYKMEQIQVIRFE